MDYKIFKGLIELREEFNYEGHKGYTLSYIRIKDFNYTGVMLDKVVIEQVIDVQNYLDNKKYTIVEREFVYPNIPVYISTLVYNIKINQK